MTATYLAWNGQSYPWPPPDGWYEASDGRWWAPGSGPGPEPKLDSPTETDPHASPDRPIIDDGLPDLADRPVEVDPETDPEPPADPETDPEPPAGGAGPRLVSRYGAAPVDDDGLGSSEPQDTGGQPEPGLFDPGGPIDGPESAEDQARTTASMGSAPETPSATLYQAESGLVDGQPTADVPAVLSGRPAPATGTDPAADQTRTETKTRNLDQERDQPQDLNTILTGPSENERHVAGLGTIRLDDSAEDPPGGHRSGLAGRLPGRGVWLPSSLAEDDDRTPLYIAAGALGVLLIAALAFIGLRGDDDQDLDAASPSETTADAIESSEDDGDTGQSGGDPTTSDDGDDTATSNGSDGSTGVSSTDGTATVQTSATGAGSSTVASSVIASSSSTTGGTTTTAGVTTTSAIITSSIAAASVDTLTDDEKVAEMRAFLDTNGLSGELLSDEDLVEFGTSFCVFAIAADDFSDYLGFREEAIAQSNSQLTDDELAMAVDGAVVTFCPDDARRLGIDP